MENTSVPLVPLPTVQPVRGPLTFGATYMALSMAIEVVLLVVVRLRIPEDNAVIASILLAVSPVAAALVCRYRRPRSILLLSIVTVLLTIALVMAFGRLTGISTGIVPPIVIRTLAGYLAARGTEVFSTENGLKVPEVDRGNAPPTSGTR